MTKNNKIIIVNWLLTRRCNLKCSYCGIVRDNPISQKKISDYESDEMTTEYVINMLRRFKKHNPNMFHIFYGGEPLLRDDLAEIINFCNNSKIFYTIITNNSDGIQDRMKKLMDDVKFISGLTSSVDPIIFQPDINKNSDRYKKSIMGLERLIALKGKVNDLVAEITIDSQNIFYIDKLVKELCENDISCSITFIDIAKNNFYDFSNVTNRNLMVGPSREVKDILSGLVSMYGEKIHMGMELISKVHSILPAEYDCKLEESLHNLTIDSDGAIRVCLRIGYYDCQKYYIDEFLDSTGEINFKLLQAYLGYAKAFTCEGCNWTCPIMSENILNNISNNQSLLHLDKRKVKKEN